MFIAPKNNLIASNSINNHIIIAITAYTLTTITVAYTPTIPTITYIPLIAFTDNML